MSDVIINLFLVAVGFFLGALTVTLFNNIKKKKDENPPVVPLLSTDLQKTGDKSAIGETPSVEPAIDPVLVNKPAIYTPPKTVTLPVEKPQKGFIAPPPVDMVQEINDILKEMSLNGDPNAVRISLIPDPSLGVSVFVSGQRFGGIAEVVDPQIKQTLQSAVRIWESRRVPGVSK